MVIGLGYFPPQVTDVEYLEAVTILSSQETPIESIHQSWRKGNGHINERIVFFYIPPLL